MSTEKFNDDIEFAKIGEAKVVTFFRGMVDDNGTPKFADVIDVRNTKKFQEMDVDFILNKGNGDVIMVEVKTDRKISDTGNLVFETLSNGNPGCLQRSAADAICYVDAVYGVMYYINLQKLKILIGNMHYKEVHMGDNAVGYLIPVDDVIKYNVCTRFNLASRQRY